MHSAPATPSRRARTTRALAALVPLLAASMALPAAADPGPSADEVAEARRAVRERAGRLGTVTAELATARARLKSLDADAERLVEAYNGEVVRLASAERDSLAAAERLRAADARFAESRAAVAALAAQSYGGVDLTRPMAAVIGAGGGGGLPGYLHQASVLQHLSGAQAEVLDRMRDAQEVAAIMRGQAAQAYDERQRAAGRAEAAKATAQAALTRQQEETEGLRQRVDVIQTRLDEARSEADRMARARAAARERAALQAAQAAVTGTATVKAARGGASAERGDIAANWALTQLGKPYVWAADGPDTYDCSGLTMRAWERAGVRLDHWTGTQWTSGPHVPLDSLRRGDLLFFGRVTANPGDIHHVGMYIGNEMMIHAPQTGDVVRVAPMWRDDLVGATRPA
ncbi:C40 family peptidase [Spongiactinospora sp. TRM90649]|uniref:C40 family peptidase n=1 Tax=Spongiactinospora sp. TRM90649 TaxID=3031114 RepID=UPI0023F9C78F|nr:C40 family peptidase [Spongiactinospora sp. TRM90649]MDF5758905.1 C40 family peptidase [Spongiactinospora sp. TRM90649]